MKIFLAGQNYLHEIIGGGYSDYIFSGGGVSGNLKPAFKRMSENNDISDDGFIKALYYENFWRGGRQGIGYKTSFRP